MNEGESERMTDWLTDGINVWMSEILPWSTLKR